VLDAPADDRKGRAPSPHSPSVFGISPRSSYPSLGSFQRRSQMDRSTKPAIHVIDPQAAVATRYIGLLNARRLSYYASGHEFLAI
jgi:hypothetical protein